MYNTVKSNKLETRKTVTPQMQTRDNINEHGKELNFSVFDILNVLQKRTKEHEALAFLLVRKVTSIMGKLIRNKHLLNSVKR